MINANAPCMRFTLKKIKIIKIKIIQDRSIISENISQTWNHFGIIQYFNYKSKKDVNSLKYIPSVVPL